MQTQSVSSFNKVALNRNNYDFPVLLEDAYDSRGKIVPKTKLVVRKDTDDVLATVSDRYRLITHKEMMDPVHDFIKRFGQVETRYALDSNGAKLVATHTFKDIQINIPGHKMPGQRKVGDVINLRCYSINSYNATSLFEFRLGAMVLKCLNGATAFDGMFNLKFRHTKNAVIDFPDPEVVVAAFEQQGNAWKTWANTEVKREQVKIMAEEGIKLQIMTKTHYEEAKTYFNGADTVWDLYNAFTYVITHNNKVKESGKLTRFDRVNALFNNELKQIAV